MHSEPQMSLWADSPARISLPPAAERAWLESVLVSSLNSPAWLDAVAPYGSASRMSPASCRRMEDGILAPSSGRWRSSGTGGPTGSTTLSTSVWPSDGSVCSLSRILETGALPQRYFLSPKACAGILRRAGRRGKSLPAALEDALRAQAGTLAPTQAEMAPKPKRAKEPVAPVEIPTLPLPFSGALDLSPQEA